MNQGNKTRATIIMGAGVLLMIAAVAFFIFARPGQFGPQTTPTPNTGPDTPYPDVPRITIKDAKAAFDEKAAVFVDTRPEASWAQMSIPGALNIPAEEMETRYAELDPNDWIILYCT
jgi:3-mercaptopyruvate sulfurtransferase SseA